MTETHPPTTTSNDDDIVELATLVLPSHAAQQGMEAGEGDQVVLEADQTTIDNFSNNAALTAVVDLEVLSELLGVSEAEFISDLHLEVAEKRVFDTTTTDTSPVDSGSAAQAAAAVDEEAPEQVLSDRVTLAADPFIETLADTLLATIDENQPSKPQDQLIQHAHHEATQEAAATKTDDDQHLAHDAFLLNIPNETSDGVLHDHYVLALPEIRQDTSVSVVSDMSTEYMSRFPLLEKAFSMLPDDLHLPSDVVNIQIEAHTSAATGAGDDATVTSSAKLDSASIAASITSALTGKTPSLAGYGTIVSSEHPAMELHLDLVVKRQVPVIGYVILISGLVALASVGAALDLQIGPSPVMKTLWRQLATSLVLSPLVFKSFYRQGLPKLTKTQWYMLPCAAAAYAYMCTAFVVALKYTSLPNAFVLSNMTSLVIILGRFVFRMPILAKEGMGAIIGFAGAAICAQASAGSVNGGEMAMFGNWVALSASFGTAIYLIFAKSLRSSMDIFVFMFSVMFLGSMFLILYMTLSGEEYTWDRQVDKGLFGWLLFDFDRLPLELFMAIVCNCLGTTGYIAVLKYFDPIVPSSVMLMEPVVGSLLGTLAGTAPLPGAQTWFGDAIVALGTFLVISSGAKTTEKIEATEALRPSTGDDNETVVSLLKSPMIRKPNANQRKADEAPGAKVVWDS